MTADDDGAATYEHLLALARHARAKGCSPLGQTALVIQDVLAWAYTGRITSQEQHLAVVEAAAGAIHRNLADQIAELARPQEEQ
jgi:hypothetical protein